MGYRIKKCLGWGLNDVVTEELAIKDTRFIESKDEWEEIFEKDIADFFDWVLNNKDETTKVLKSALPKGLMFSNTFDILLRMKLGEDWKKGDKIDSTRWSRGYSFDAEFGLPNVMMFIPVENPEWDRYDDDLDYYEASMGQDAEPKLNILNSSGIFPHLGIIKIPHEPEVEGLGHYIDPGEWKRLRGTFLPSRGPSRGEDIAEQVKRSYRPKICDSVMLYTYWLGIWKDWKTTVQELRPMIYTYWG